MKHANQQANNILTILGKANNLRQIDKIGETPNFEKKTAKTCKTSGVGKSKVLWGSPENKKALVSVRTDGQIDTFW